MTVEWTSVNNHLVACDHDKPWRWSAVVGPNARQWSLNAATDYTSTTTAAGSVVTVTNGTLVSLDSALGGGVVLTLAGADNDKVELQSAGEPFFFGGRYPAYFGLKFQLVDADQTDMHAGFIIRDTDLAGGVADGIYVRLVDQSAVLALVLEKGTAETTVELATLADATDYTVELYIDGAYVYAYLNGALATSVATSNANFPNTEHLTATIGAQAGEIAANNMTVYWARAFQILEA